MARLSSVLPAALRRQRTQAEGAGSATDGRPHFAVGHVTLSAADVGALADFYASIGMRKVARLPGVAILELRGGTHLAIGRGPSGQGHLDLMVDDLPATRAMLDAAGARPSEIRRSMPHRVFDATDPEGNTLLVNSSHVTGQV